MNFSSPVTDLPKIGPSYAAKLDKLGVKTVKDLLYHIPHRYLDFSNTADISLARAGEVITVRGKIKAIKNQYTRSGRKMQIGQIYDASGNLTVVWFNQPFLVRTFYPECDVALAGKVDWFGRTKALISPEYELINKENIGLHTGRLVAVYPETSGLSSKWLRSRLKSVYDLVGDSIHDPLTPEIIKQNKLISLPAAVKQIHWPQSPEEAKSAKYRLAFDELLALHLLSLRRKKEWEKLATNFQFSINQSIINQLISKLPFRLTKSQETAVKEILDDLEKDHPMNRLLEGDVGSGKTVVAAIAAFAVFIAGGQSVIMAPTQILAEQHFQTFNDLLKNYKVRIALITGNKKIIDPLRADIIIGTHALLHNRQLFENSALVIIDEQHKFGVRQRETLTSKSPHLLTMTATPIPRTIALTAYGDQDLSVLTETPAGRQPVTTWIVPPEKRTGGYEWIKKQISDHQIQVFIVCPLIDESESLAEVKAVTAEYTNIVKIFPDYKIGLMHGRLKPKDKEKVIEDFRQGKLNILVSTPVIEVGIDIGNANIILIENADHFGLAQLHQLRGRIGRGERKAFCLLYSESQSEKSQKRLSALARESSGFKLAEMDLTLRGPGEIFGTVQHGFPELSIADWTDVKLIKTTRAIAEKMILE